MAYVVLTLIVSIVLLLFSYLHRHYTYWQRRGVPGERPYPFLGNLMGIGRTVHFRNVNDRIYKRFKGSAPFAGVFFFMSKVAMLMDLELIKHVLIKDFSNFHDRGFFNNVRDDPLTGHLLALEGDQWRAMRTKLSPVFTSGKMKLMFPTVVAVSENLAKACGKQMDASPAAVVDLQELCARYTTDVIGTCAFGIDCNCLENPQAEFREMGRQVRQQPRHHMSVMAFMLSNPGLARKLRMKFFSDAVSQFFLSIVAKTVQHRIENKVKRNDFMQMLIEMKAQNEEIVRNSHGVDLSLGLTIEQMAAQSVLFFIAGFDTSSTTMSWTLYELILNTKIQDRLREEIQQKLEAHNGELTYESIDDMPYLEMVLSETLRKYPVLPHLLRKTISDYVVPGSNMIIERNTSIVIPIDAIHHDPELYPEPNKFDPERFSAAAMQNRHPCAYLPFGNGPRMCIGMRFGKMQAKIGLIALLRKYKFSVCESSIVPLQIDKTQFILTPKDSINLRVERI